MPHSPTPKQPARIITLVQFPLPAGTTLAQAAERFRETAPKYQKKQGLLAKHYVFRDGYGGAVYLWESRAAAEALFTPEWQAFIRDRYGADPVITWFDNPVTVDNMRGEIHS